MTPARRPDRTRPVRRDRGPGFAPFPRHGVLRTNDLVGPAVEPRRVRAALAARGIPVGDREEPVGTGVRALLAATAAGTVITLERRGSLLNPRWRVLGRLARTLDNLVRDLENDALDSQKPA